MQDYISRAKEVIERVENNPEEALMYEEFSVPLMLEMIDRLDTIISRLPSSSSVNGTLV